MENPTLTFVTPTLLAGDRSAVGTLIHELAHSWFGNAITCRTWECFWMNEGFTCWLERKIVGRLYGQPSRDLDVLLHDADLRNSLVQFRHMPIALSLVQDLTMTDPDDTFSSVPYEKGSQLLYWLEKAIVRDSPLTFEACIQAWIKKTLHSNVTSEQFQAFFEDFYSRDADVQSRMAQIPWHAWFHDRDPNGCPVDVMRYCDDSLLVQAADLAQYWADTKGLGDRPVPVEFAGFNTQLKAAFIGMLASRDGVPRIDAQTRLRLDAAYGVSKMPNFEIRLRWLTLTLQLGVLTPDVVDSVKRYLAEQGRMKFCRPIYRLLAKLNPQLARDVLESCRAGYHPICTRMCLVDLKNSGA